MRSMPAVAAVVLLGTVATNARQPATGGPVFDVVSIRPSPGSVRLGNHRERPGGGYLLEKGTAEDVIAYAYAIAPANVIGLPGWASRDVYDITATGSAASPTLDDRRAMVRAMLAGRFRLRAHEETRDQPSFDLVAARTDGRLGTGLNRYEVDCEALARADREARAAGATPAFDPKQPQCSVRMTRTGLTGQMSMDMLANVLRAVVGRSVVDKTGLAGTYRVQMEFDASIGVSADSQANAGPSVFQALQEQLGLKLEPSRASAPVLVIDAIERPTEN
jgi:uncharacterized protein (TIGR03435 family)